MRFHDGWLVEFWSFVFFVLDKVSVFYWLRQLMKLLGLHELRTSYGFVEVWVTAHTIIAAIVLVLTTTGLLTVTDVVFPLILYYGGLRVFETVVYQINVLLFDEYRRFKLCKLDSTLEPYKVRSFRRLVLLLLHNYFEVLCWFALFYVYFNIQNDLSMQHGISLVAVVRESLYMMIAFGPEANEAISPTGQIILTIHSFVGVYMTVIVLSRFLALLPSPQSKDEMDGA